MVLTCVAWVVCLFVVLLYVPVTFAGRVVIAVLVKVVDQLTVLVDTEDGQQVVLVLHEAEPLDEKTDTLDVDVKALLMMTAGSVGSKAMHQ